MGGLLRSLDYYVQASKVMIVSMRFIFLVSITLIHPYEHHPMQRVVSGLFNVLKKLAIFIDAHRTWVMH
jgi:hypothetical protein